MDGGRDANSVGEGVGCYEINQNHSHLVNLLLTFKNAQL